MPKAKKCDGGGCAKSTKKCKPFLNADFSFIAITASAVQSYLMFFVVFGLI